MRVPSPPRIAALLLVGVPLAVWGAPGLVAGQGAGEVRVRVEGIGGELRRNVEQRLSIIQRIGGVSLLDIRIRRLHEQAEGEIRTALQPFGFYRPEVAAALEPSGGGWVASYRIRPGPQLRYASVDVRVVGPGSSDSVLVRAVARYPVRVGEPLRHPDWTRAKERLLHRATARGYLDAAFEEQRVDVDLTVYEARAVLRLETGPRYRFGAVRFEGTHFDRAFLRRFVPFSEGDPFILEQLLAVQMGLASSPYFRKVDVSPVRDEAVDLRVPVVVSVEHRARTGVSAGGGYGTDTGPRGTLTWDRRWLGDGGDRLHAEFRASWLRRTVSGAYIVPVGRQADDNVAVTLAGQDDESFEAARSQSVQTAVAYDHGWGGWRETLSLSLKSEWFDVGGTESRSTLLLPALFLIRSRADDPFVPTRGSRVSFRLTGAHRTILSDVSFVQLMHRSWVVRSPVEGGRVIGRLDLGATVVDDFAELPVSHRFFAGGDESVRGFAVHALGPRNDAGEVVGGRHLIAASLEYEQRIVGPFSLAVFGDTGNALSELTSSPALESGVGTGVRWRSPVGPVRLDVAWAVSRKGDPVRLHFTVGSAL